MPLLLLLTNIPLLLYGCSALIWHYKLSQLAFYAIEIICSSWTEAWGSVLRRDDDLLVFHRIHS